MQLVSLQLVVTSAINLAKIIRQIYQTFKSMKENRALGRQSSPKSCSNARSTIIFNVAWQHHTFNFYVEKMCDRELQMPCLLFLNGYFLIKQSACKNEILNG